MAFANGDPVVLTKPRGSIPAGAEGCVLDQHGSLVAVDFGAAGMQFVSEQVLVDGVHQCVGQVRANAPAFDHDDPVVLNRVVGGMPVGALGCVEGRHGSLVAVRFEDPFGLRFVMDTDLDPGDHPCPGA